MWLFHCRVLKETSRFVSWNKHDYFIVATQL